MRELRVGDIVRVVSKVSTRYNRRGRIIDYHKKSKNPLIEFFDFISWGHDGLNNTKSGKRYKSNNCLYLEDYEMELSYSFLDLYLKSKQCK